MSLNVDARSIKAEFDLSNPLTVLLAHMMMVLGMGEISEKNHVDVFTRLDFYQRLFANGDMLKSGTPGSDRNFTLQDVKDRIGLKVNVMQETDAKFIGRLYKSFKQDTARAAK